MLSLLVKTRLMVLRTILSLFLRILGKFVRIDDQLILFVSFNGKSYSDNPRYLFEYMRERVKNLLIIVLFGLLKSKSRFWGRELLN